MAASRLSLHRQQALGEALDGELARLGDLFLGAAAGVLGLGLGAQEGVGQLGVAGLEVGRGAAARLAVRRAGRRCGPHRRRRRRRGRCGVVRVHPDDVEAHPPHFKREFLLACEPRRSAPGRPTRSSGSSRPAGAGRAWSGGPARSPRPARAPSLRAASGRLARGDALGRLRVQRLGHRRRAAHRGSARRPRRVRGSAALAQLERVADAHLARRLGRSCR